MNAAPVCYDPVRFVARDIARSHGGDITLGDSPLGGLRATVRVPV